VSHVLVSVVIPVRDRADLLRRAVDSVLRQTHRPLEVVVVDDCSREDLAAALADMRADDARVVVLRNVENIGAQASRLVGVRAAQGDVVALLDSDDWWEPTKLQQQLEVLRQQPSSLVACRMLLATTGKATPPVVIEPGEPVEEYVYSRGGFLQSSTFLAPRSLLLAGLSASQMGGHDDTHLAICLRALGVRIVQLEAALSHFDDFPRGDRLSIKHAEADKAYQLFKRISSDWSRRAKAGYLVRDTVRRHIHNHKPLSALATLARGWHPGLPQSLYARTLLAIVFGGSPLRFFRRRPQ
jgi:glycosyltransferase involved in cell wall biosynthesis